MISKKVITWYHKCLDRNIILFVLTNTNLQNKNHVLISTWKKTKKTNK